MRRLARNQSHQLIGQKRGVIFFAETAEAPTLVNIMQALNPSPSKPAKKVVRKVMPKVVCWRPIKSVASGLEGHQLRQWQEESTQTEDFGAYLDIDFERSSIRPKT